MAWPFTSAPAPTFDTGIVAIPTSVTAVTTDIVWLMGLDLVNTTGTAITVTVTDSASQELLASVTIPGNAAVPIERPFKPVTGLRWVASGAGLKGHMWGYR